MVVRGKPRKKGDNRITKIIQPSCIREGTVKPFLNISLTMSVFAQGKELSLKPRSFKVEAKTISLKSLTEMEEGG